jgi:cytochrome c
VTVRVVVVAAAALMGVVGGVMGNAAVAAGVNPRTTLQEQGSQRRSVWDGVFTDAQAKRGRDAYAYSCATCHLPDLEGDPGRDVPALAGDEFVDGWNKKSVKDLFDLIRKAMPKDAAGSLRPETYADLVAYLLQSNEFPSGAQELATDGAALQRIGIDKAPPVAK